MVKSMNKKEMGSRSKIKRERELRLKQKIKVNQKKRTDEEFKSLITRQNIESLGQDEKKSMMKKLYNLILAFPNQNHDKIQLLFLFCEDKSFNVVIKSLKFLTNIFYDLAPSYKIRKQTETEEKVAKSKEVENLKNFEDAFLHNYNRYLGVLDVFLKMKKSQDSVKNLQAYCVAMASKIFQKLYYFNYSEILYKLVVNQITHRVGAVREIAFDCLKSVLSKVENTESYLELKLKIFGLVTHIIYNQANKGKFDDCVLDLLTFHKIEFPDQESLNKSKEYNLKVSKKNKKNKAANGGKLTLEEKVVKSVKQEMSEYEENINYEAIYNLNLKILKKILLLYLEILRNRRDSPYIRNVLSGIGILCDNINVEILLDIQKNIYKYIAYIFEEVGKGKIERLGISITALKTCLTITEKLTKDIISVEDTSLTTLVYTLLGLLSNQNMVMKRQDVIDLLELIDTIVLKYRQFSVDTVGSFLKRISILCKFLDARAVPAFLLVMRKLLDKYPIIHSLLDSEYENGEDDFFNYKINDPTLSNSKQTNILKELKEIRNKYKTNSVITNLCDYCGDLSKKNAKLTSLSHFNLIYEYYKE